MGHCQKCEASMNLSRRYFSNPGIWWRWRSYKKRMHVWAVFRGRESSRTPCGLRNGTAPWWLDRALP